MDSSVVKQFGMDAGASVVGIAVSGDFRLAPEGFRPTDVLEGCRSVIVLGAAHPPEALGNPDNYTAARNAMLAKMTDMAKAVAKRIKAAGYQSKVISAAGGKWVEGDGRKEQFGYISLKHAAELAGIGIIARNNLLTSPVHGNLLWLSAVLTDAELTPDEKLQWNICEGCNKCVEACPSGALADPVRFKRKQCDRFFVIENKRFMIKCFACREICPHRFGVPS